jgi:hypothetical protein
MTFKPAGYVGEENLYQGLTFKFGSMMGVPLTGTAGRIMEDFRIYYPTSDTGWSPNGATIASVFGSSANTANGRIPYFLSSFPFVLSNTDPWYFTNDTITSKIPAFEYVVGTEKKYLGDICRRINPDYRLPTASDMLSGYHVVNYSGPWGAESAVLGWQTGNVWTENDVNTIVLTENDGTDVIPYFVTSRGAIFPISRPVKNYEGDFPYNRYAYLTSTGTGSQHFFVGMYIYPLRVLQDVVYSYNGFPVRCVKN